MGKIIIFAIFGLIIIGSLGWAIGEQSPRLGHQARQDTRFPTAAATPNRTRIEADMLAGWMLRGETPYLLIDTRPTESFSSLHLRRAINREIGALLSLQSLRRLPRHKPIVIYGADDRENAAAVEVLRMSGLTAFYLPGGHADWASLPTNRSTLGISSLASTRKPESKEISASQTTPARFSKSQRNDDTASNPEPTLQLGMLNH